MPPSTQPRHPIQVVARRTGLSADTLRAWEKRYRAVTPRRAPGGRRLYSDDDVERLVLLRRGVGAGRRIGQIAGLSSPQLRELIVEDEDALRSRPGPSVIPPRAARGHLAACLDAVVRLDGMALEQELDRSRFDLAPRELLTSVLAPLMEEIGNRWERGEIGPSQEHLASSMVRSLLGIQALGRPVPRGAPLLLVTTPSGQLHEIGALMAAVAAAAEGWRVVYLGPNLPANEIGRAAREVGASAVALSITHPVDDTVLATELEALRGHLGEGVPLLVGGRAAAGYDDALRVVGALRVSDFDHFGRLLQAARRKPRV